MSDRPDPVHNADERMPWAQDYFARVEAQARGDPSEAIAGSEPA
jgi:hypothetical protein